MQIPTFPIESSAIVAINSRALLKKSQGERVFNLSIGEPLLPPHPVIVEAAERAIREGKTQYSPAAGIPELRAAFAGWLNATYATQFSVAETIITCGGKFALFALCQLFIKPGDEAIIFSPYWVSYPSMVRLGGGQPVVVPTTEANGWKPDLQALEQAITSKTKLLIINSAGNPTGALYSRAELQAILAMAAQHDLLVVSDEVYSGLTYDGAEFISAGSFSEYRDRVVVIQSCSKHFAMTGWRVGAAFGPQAIIEQLTTLQTQSTTGTSSISQFAALGALARAGEVLPYVRGALELRRRAFLAALQEYFKTTVAIPAGLYAFVSLAALGNAERDSARVCRRLIDDANIALVPGAAFGAEGYVRLSFGAPEAEIVEALRMFSNWSL